MFSKIFAKALSGKRARDLIEAYDLQAFFSALFFELPNHRFRSVYTFFIFLSHAYFIRVCLLLALANPGAHACRAKQVFALILVLFAILSAINNTTNASPVAVSILANSSLQNSSINSIKLFYPQRVDIARSEAAIIILVVFLSVLYYLIKERKLESIGIK
ncbi:MAG: hypothetical protein QXL16_02475 [Candidatus Micrarchaeaceae archaeon]